MTTEWFWKESLWSLSGGIMNGAMRGSYLYEMLVGPAPGPALLSIHQRHSQPIKMCPGVQTIWDGQTLANTMGRENVPKSSTKNTIFFYSCKPMYSKSRESQRSRIDVFWGPSNLDDLTWHKIGPFLIHTFGDTLCQEFKLGNFCAGETGSHMTAS